MKMTFSLVLALLSSLTFAQEFFLVQNLSDVAIHNSAGARVYKRDLSEYKSFLGRKNLWAFYDIFGTVTIGNAKGEIIVNRAYSPGRFIITDNVISTTGAGGNVYNSDGKLIFNHPNTEVFASNNLIATRNNFTGFFEVKDKDRNTLYANRNITNSMISDQFFIVQADVGWVEIYDVNYDLIASDTGGSRFFISNGFVGYQDPMGWMRVFNTDKKEIFSQHNVQDIKVMNNFFIVKYWDTWHVYNRDGQMVNSRVQFNNIQVSANAVAIQSRESGFLEVFAGNSGDRVKTFNVTEGYHLTNNLLYVKRGPYEHEVYDLKTWKKVYSAFNHTIQWVSVSDHLIGVKSSVLNGVSVYNTRGDQVYYQSNVQNLFLSDPRIDLFFRAF